MNRREALLDVLATATLAILTIALYRKITRLWWMYDDPYLLRIAFQQSARDHFFSSALWLSMPQQLFTPLLTASYDAQLTLFGANPRRFYVFHLTELVLTTVALYWTLRLWLSRLAAFSSSVLFISGVTVVTMATQLMVMHYVVSVLMAIISTWFFVQAMRRGSWFFTIVSALFYFLAILAKEVAVPLPAILLMLPEADTRSRLRRVWPHASALFIWLIWRTAILGKLVGGYALYGLSELPLRAVRTPFLAIKSFAGQQLAIGIPLLILIAVGVVALARNRRRLLLIVAAFFLAVAPVIPAARWYENRFSYAAWLCVAVLFAAGADSLRDWRLSAVLLLVTPLVALAANRAEWARVFANAQRMSKEARAFAELEPGDFLRNAAIPPPSMIEMAWLKENLLHGPSGARWFYDDLYLCLNPKPKRVFGYDNWKRVHEITAGIDAIAKRHCASIHDNQPLTAHFRYANEVLFWDVGPYDRGSYRAVLGDGTEAFDIKRRDALRVVGARSITVRVRYDSPEGWITYSPGLKIDLTGNDDVVWRR